MNKDEIAQMIQEALDARELYNQMNPSPIPYHTHSGTDSAPIDLGANGIGEVTNVSVVNANGISGIVTNPTTTPAITLTLGNITPTSVAASGNVTGANLPAPTGDTTKFLNANGAFSTPTSGGVLVGTATVGQYSSQEFDIGNATGTKTIDWSNGNVQYVTLTGNTTFTFTNPISGGRYVLHVASAFTPTWPSGVRWPSSVTPTPTAVLGRKDVYTFVYSAKETLYDGAQNANYAII